MKSLLTGLIGTCLLLATVAHAQVSTLYGVTFFDNDLISINSATGASTLIGSLGANVNGYGIAFRGNQLYTFDPTVDRIRQINTSTGKVVSSIDIGVGNLTGEGDLAFRSDGIGFLTSALKPDFSPSNDLFRFDLATDTSTRVGTTAVPLNALTFIGSTLYGIGKEGTPSLYIIDQTNGHLTTVGLLGIAANSPLAAITLTSTGQLLAAIDDRLYSIDQSTGAATVVSKTVLDFGYYSVSGLAAAPSMTSPVPEPSTYGAVATVACIWLAWSRRRKAPAQTTTTV